MRNMGTVSELKMGAVAPPTLGSNAFYSTTIQSIKVPEQSVDDYKSATRWSSKSSVINNY